MNEFVEQRLIFSRSFCFVRKIKHKNSGKIFAIKKLLLNGDEYKKALIELNLLKKLKSRYVVELVDSWIEDFSESQTFSGVISSHPIFKPRNTLLLHIQMEYCFQNLNDVIKHLSNEMKENDSKVTTTMCYYICCELLIEIVECLNYLHERNVIHRNLKPPNILITEGLNGRFVKLTDFGLSLFNEQNMSLETLDYKAPEVIRYKKYDIKADMYSLGIIIEELFFLKNDL